MKCSHYEQKGTKCEQIQIPLMTFGKKQSNKKKKKGTNTESRREDFMWDLKKHRSNTGRVKAQCYFSIFSTSIFSLYGVTIPENFGKAQVCLSWL